MNKIFKIKLTPLSTFFFGGEKSFGNSVEQNYFVKSQHFPQQTTLLGLLRFELLRQNGWIPDPSKGNKLSPGSENVIGETGFPSDDYRCIKSLSPVFLQNNSGTNQNDHWFIQPLDADFRFIRNFGKGKMKLLSAEKSGLPLMDKYDLKKYYPAKLVNKIGKSIEIGDIFKEQLQTGIDKNKPDEAYYKQLYMRFSGDWSFVFYANMDLGNNKLASNMTWMGGERSFFSMEVIPIREVLVTEKFWEFPINKPQPDKNGRKVVLHSPAYVKPELFDLFDFAYSRIIPFLYLKSNVNMTKSYYNRPGTVNEEALQRKEDFPELFESGSVFYFSDVKATNEFIKGINDRTDFQNIGYNYYSVENI